MTDEALTVGSLFSGIGGLDLGLERAGMRVIWQCEIDKYARRVLEKHWPGIPCYPDVRELGVSIIPERVDVLCGGFPCQDISTAGRRAGIHGERSGLFFEIVRLARVLRPRYIVLENVAALTIRGLDTVLGELALCGYDAEWDCISAASIGALHRRDRLFIVAYPMLDPEGVQSRTVPEAQGEVWGRAEGGLSSGCGEVLADTHLPRCEVCQPSGCGEAPSGRTDNVPDPQGQRGGGGDERGDWPYADAGPFEGARADNRLRAFRDDVGEWWAVEPDVGRVANGVPSRVDRLKCLGNAVVPQVGEYVGRCLVEFDRMTQKFDNSDKVRE
jgi:DNA (cytosine-5)-methyltransferase 1